MANGNGELSRDADFLRAQLEIAGNQIKVLAAMTERIAYLEEKVKDLTINGKSAAKPEVVAT